MLLIAFLSIQSYKPCSVIDNHLSMLMHPFLNSVLQKKFPDQIWVSRLWGLPVPLVNFLTNRHCGTFKGLPYFTT